jgi:hypothetical protein
VKEGQTTNNLFACLTTDANKVVGAIHPKAMPHHPHQARGSRFLNIFAHARGRISNTIRRPRPHAVYSNAWLCGLAATRAEICRGKRLCLGGDI